MPKHPPNQLRIIGGTWRGRKLAFPDARDLRPTPDRVRETLFNWLQPLIAGARCLDLFAGSGALGLEAASRGASEVVLVERDHAAAAQLNENVKILRAQGVSVIEADALMFLRGSAQAFDVVFLDPPYDRPEWLASACERLDTGGWLAADARVYLETRASDALPALPLHWEILRSKRAGQVAYHLARVTAAPAA